MLALDYARTGPRSGQKEFPDSHGSAFLRVSGHEHTSQSPCILLRGVVATLYLQYHTGIGHQRAAGQALGGAR